MVGFESNKPLIHSGTNIAFDPHMNAIDEISRAEATSTTAEHLTPVDLTWEDLRFSVPVKQQKGAAAPGTADATKAGASSPGVKQILKGISGYARRGSMVAIMGPSGSGKSSLLNLLSGRMTSTPNASVTGSILVNGEQRNYDKFSKLAAYVMQDDDMFGALTVREQLLYAARLRLPATMSIERKKARVERVIAELGLSKVADSQIGDEFIRGVSGGERKRVSIGTELVTDASMLFLDEPTSGLDSFNALNVMTNLRTLATKGRTIVCTIHQPRSSIFQLFDLLLLLSEGRAVYFGPASEAIPYFESLQFPSPRSFNPADFFLDLVSLDPRSSELEENTSARIEFLVDKHHATLTPDKIAAVNEESREADRVGLLEVTEADAAKSGVRDDAPVREYEQTWWNEFQILSQRAVRVSLRAATPNAIRMFQTVFFGIMLGILWGGLGRKSDLASRQAILGVLFFAIINQTFVALFSVIFNYPSERNVVTRERASKSYRASSYYISKTLTDLPQTVLFNLVFVFILFFSVGLNPRPGAFFQFLLLILGVSLYGETLAISVSILTGNAQITAALAPPLIIIPVLFGGFFIAGDLIPDWLAWLRWVSYIFYAFNAFVRVEFPGRPQADVILSDPGLNSLSYWGNFGVLLGIAVFINFVGYLSLQYLRGPKFLKL